MEPATTEATLSDWLQRYGRERPYRQQAQQVLERLVDEFPEVFLAAAPRLLTEEELALVAGEILACAAAAVAGVAAGGRRVCEAVAA